MIRFFGGIFMRITMGFTNLSQGLENLPGTDKSESLIQSNSIYIKQIEKISNYSSFVRIFDIF